MLGKNDKITINMPKNPPNCHIVDVLELPEDR